MGDQAHGLSVPALDSIRPPGADPSTAGQSGPQGAAQVAEPASTGPAPVGLVKRGRGRPPTHGRYSKGGPSAGQIPKPDPGSKGPPVIPGGESMPDGFVCVIRTPQDEIEGANWIAALSEVAAMATGDPAWRLTDDEKEHIKGPAGQVWAKWKDRVGGGKWSAEILLVVTVGMMAIGKYRTIQTEKSKGATGGPRVPVDPAKPS